MGQLKTHVESLIGAATAEVDLLRAAEGEKGEERKLHWAKWKTFWAKKESGGLGFNDLGALINHSIEINFDEALKDAFLIMRLIRKIMRTCRVQGTDDDGS
ncbi:unnamed protein product [Dovyalis caffra]|uniref:Uncharacterized protein n=1 Tax=Dovyalis caffra TaxID=77055 RepID=A0AAV1SD25_9ROSI|nr:unnamed protein product [Dovyalis caffra]